MWPTKLMVEGVWRDNVAATPEIKELCAAHTHDFRGTVAASGHSGLRAEPHRYHLYVSFACPFAHRVILARALKGLRDVVGMSVLHPCWNTPDGWVFGDSGLSTIDLAGNGFTHLHQAYSASRADYTGKVTVPVLWDRKTGAIVNNESAEILMMLDRAGGDPAAALCPEELQNDIDRLDRHIIDGIALGVYAVGDAETQDAYDLAQERLFHTLDGLEARLSDGRSLLHGDRLTTSDLLLFTPLARFDAVYNPLFRANRRRLIDYPRLSAWARRVHDLPGVADTLRFDHILRHYYDGWAPRNLSIVPACPAVDFRTVGLAA